MDGGGWDGEGGVEWWSVLSREKYIMCSCVCILCCCVHV